MKYGFMVTLDKYFLSQTDFLITSVSVIKIIFEDFRATLYYSKKIFCPKGNFLCSSSFSFIR